MNILELKAKKPQEYLPENPSSTSQPQKNFPDTVFVNTFLNGKWYILWLLGVFSVSFRAFLVWLID